MRRRLRVSRGLSLSELSRRSGVAKGTLSKLEASIGNPTLETLWSVANALDVPFDDLFAEPGDGVFVVRNAELRTLALPGVQAHVIDRVFGREASDVAELVYLAGQVRHAIPDVPGTTTRIYVAEGHLRVELPSETLDLEPRDFARYDSDVEHRYIPGDRDARVLMIVSFGSGAWRAGGEERRIRKHD